MSVKRVNIKIQGTVQGVGFRPFIYRLANHLGLYGFVQNSTFGVTIEAEGEISKLDAFIIKIRTEKPNLTTFTNFEYNYLDFFGYDSFQILESGKCDNISALILPDIAICPDCLKEMNDPNDRRFQYPFINCTNCGSRFSIIESLPYDRPNITMKIFNMCPKCQLEYENPNDRRYHAQPIACPVCGPHVELWDSKGRVISRNNEAITEACNIILAGQILALKGIGGFQLLVDARNTDSIQKLRVKKHRDEKPFALMCPNFETAKLLCDISKLEEILLNSTESPIVLLKKKERPEYIISDEIAPGNHYLGIMLPYSPIHYLILSHLKIPVIATSGNITDEPMCIDEYEALDRLQNIADYFLVHNRPILRHIDDSVARIVNGRVMVIRRARGYAPLPIESNENNISASDNSIPILAVGGQLKNSIALKVGSNIFVSQHIGDLETQEANKAFQRIISDFEILYKIQPKLVVTDSHPDYYSTKYAKALKSNIKSVQHHIAHIASCRAENHVKGKALGIAWDGTGYGLDGTVWGGEFFITNEDSCFHSGSFRQFPLPGGDQAIKEPRRSALGMLYEIYGDSLFDKHLTTLHSEVTSDISNSILQNFSQSELSILRKMLVNKVNCPLTSSVGRLFDVVASLLNLKQKNNFEGQAAMMLEFSASPNEIGYYSYDKKGYKFLTIDWQPLIEQIFSDLIKNINIGIISAKFHNTLVEIIISAARFFGEEKVVLSGGCFQNVYLLERTIKKLEKNKFKVYWHQRIPTNDGGIALGQIAASDWTVGSYKDNESN